MPTVGLADQRIDEVRTTRSTSLDLSNTGLRQVPTAVRGLTYLQELRLDENQSLRELPDWLGELTELRTLDLENCGVTELPESMTRLGRLRKLRLSHTSLAVWPDWLADLPLTILYLDGMDLRSVPPTVLRMSALEVLALDDNNLTALPEEIGDLRKLRALYLAMNRLRELPDTLGSLPDLTTLDVEGNPLPALDPALLGDDATLIDWLRSRVSGESRNWRSRVLVVGEAAVGKTSLVRALSGLDHRPGEPTTHGMSVANLPFPHPTEPAATMRLGLWDFGGQPNYQACHQFFFSGRALFLVVWDTRNGADRDRVVHWIETVEARAPGAPIIVVATHADERAADLDTDLTARFPGVMATLAVDCAGPRNGIAALRKRIAEVAATLPLMGAGWPAAWDKAAQALRDHDGAQISVPAMRELMIDAGVDEGSVGSLTSVLHSLGDILYPESPARKIIGDLVTLDPAWLNARISQILDRQEIQDRAGVLTRADLDEIWPDLDRETSDYLLAMTEEYDLGYPITDSRDSGALALVVDRLARAEPDLAPWHKAGADPDMRRIRIRYVPAKALPGIPAWFIAREYRFSCGYAWRRGALLRDPRNDDWALVRTGDDGTVELEVRGRYAPSRFFGIVDDGLHQTFDRYPGLTVSREIPCPCADDCRTGYPEEVVHKRLARNLATISCTRSGEDVDMHALLEGILPTRKTLRSEDRHAVAALSRESGLIELITAQTEASMRRVLQEQLQREFSRNRSIKQICCPSVVTVTEQKSSIGKTVYRLNLWCDQPGQWHQLPESTGSYELAEPARWLRELGPHLRRVAKILSVTVPIGKAAFGLAADELDGRLHEDLESWHTDLAKIPSHLDVPEFKDALAEFDAAGRVLPHRIAVLDSEYRILEQTLTAMDPKRRWGGLNRVATAEGHVFYLCDEHTREYERHPVPLRPEDYQ